MNKSLEKDIWIEKDKIEWKFWWYKPWWWLDYVNNEFIKMDDNGELIVLYWPPWSWKTEFWFFVSKANKEARTVYFCLEIPEDTILKRWALRKNWLSWADVDSNNISQEQQEKCINSINYFKSSTKDYFKMVSISEQPSIEQLLYKMELEKKDKTIFIIDNLWKITWDDNENVRFADITAKLQTFAYNNRCWVMLQHHTIKPPAQNKSKDIENVFAQSLFWPYWFRWSQKIFDNATRMIEIHRDYQNNKTMLLQYKHTPTDTRRFVELSFDRWEYKPFTF